VAAPHGHAAKDRRARDGYCSLSAPAPRPPAIAAVVATAIAAVVATAIAAVIATTAAVTTATAVIDLDNMAGRGRRRGGYHCRLSRSGFGHSRWCGGNSYRGSARRQHWCDVFQSYSHGSAP
jgi:hypothetical protein